MKDPLPLSNRFINRRRSLIFRKFALGPGPTAAPPHPVRQVGRQGIIQVFKH
jgi:hypothetical protein